MHTLKRILSFALALALVLGMAVPAGAEEVPEETVPPATEVPEGTAPATEPYEEPTEVPTEAPAEKPEEAPTEVPSEEPTEAPTEDPVEEPVESAEAGTRAAVASGTCGDNLTWVLDDSGTLTISGTGPMDNYYWYRETPWCDYKDTIKKLVVSQGVTTIGGYSFAYFNSLTSVSLPNSLVLIGQYAFNECKILPTINIPDGVTDIGGYAFSGCSRLTNVTIGSGVAHIGGSAFNSCIVLKSISVSPNNPNYSSDASGVLFNKEKTEIIFVPAGLSGDYTLPYGVITIGDYMFYRNSKLTSVTIPDSVTEMGTGVFAKCDNLTSVIFSKRITSIGAYMFENCSSLTSVTLPDSVTSIGAYAFSGCSSLTGVNIPEGVTTIGDYAFEHCHSLTRVDIPGKVKTIGKYAFRSCTALTGIFVASGNTNYSSDVNGVLYDKAKSTLIQAPGVITVCQIPDSVTKIGNSAFYNCTKLTDISIGSNVVTIGDSAFGNCQNLKSLTIPDCVTTIGDNAFYNCSSLTHVNIGTEVSTVGYCSFSHCKSLRYVVFNGETPVFSSLSFDCTKTVAYYPNNHPTWTKSVMKDYGGQITWIGYDPALTVPAKPYKVANVVSGVHVYWNAVPGVTKYGLWRSDNGPDGYYQWMGNPKTNHFTDTKVESGKTYYYCVSTCDPNTNAHSMMSDPIGITYLSTPDITERLNRQPGIQLTWDQITGATGYRIYRKSYSGNDAWVKVGEVTGNDTLVWVDTSVQTQNGQMYRYTVRAVCNNTLSGCRSAGRSMMRLTGLTLKQVTKTGTGTVKVSWNTSKLADGYEIRFMNGNTIVKQFTIGNYKTGVKTFSGIPTGATYKVQVRRYVKVDGMGFYSAWSPAINIKL